MKMATWARTASSTWIALACALAANGCGGGGDDDPAATVPATATAEPTSVPGTGPVGGGKSLRSADSRLEITGQGRVLDVTIVAMEKPPAAPKGWVFNGPVFDISARDAGRLVTMLEAPLKLTFRGDGTGTVMTHAGGEWEIIPSERLGDGSIEASITHLSPYAVARPATAAQVRSSATPTATPTTAASRTPTKTAVPGPSASPEGGATVSVTAIPTATAKDQLEAAIAVYKTSQVRVSNASGYTGVGTVALPPGLTSALNVAYSVGGSAVGGTYGVINEAFSAKAATGSATGSFTFLAEPQTTFPSSSSSAQQQLVALFPGAAGYTYTTVSAGATGYIYSASAGNAVIVLGFIQYQDLSIAYLASGSGTYLGPAISARAP